MAQTENEFTIEQYNNILYEQMEMENYKKQNKNKQQKRWKQPRKCFVIRYV